jgi:hypothetical protein
MIIVLFPVLRHSRRRGRSLDESSVSDSKETNICEHRTIVSYNRSIDTRDLEKREKINRESKVSDGDQNHVTSYAVDTCSPSL